MTRARVLLAATAAAASLLAGCGPAADAPQLLCSLDGRAYAAGASRRAAVTPQPEADALCPSVHAPLIY